MVLGRLDKMLADLYQKDIDTDILTEEKACELVYDFLNQLSKYASYKSDALEGDIGQIIILGGNQPNGKYFLQWSYGDILERAGESKEAGSEDIPACWKEYAGQPPETRRVMSYSKDWKPTVFK